MPRTPPPKTSPAPTLRVKIYFYDKKPLKNGNFFQLLEPDFLQYKEKFISLWTNLTNKSK